MKITPEYLEQNRKLHEGGYYGLPGQRWAKTVLNVCEVAGSRDVLDYGCGQRTLEKSLGFPIRNYDPCIPGLDAPPEPADVVACTDVLEHIAAIGAELGREPEVDEHRQLAAPDQDVVGLEVAVDHALAVHVRERAADAAQDRQRSHDDERT